MSAIVPPVDNWLQQAVAKQLAPKFELDFEDESYGFRREKAKYQLVLDELSTKEKAPKIAVCRAFSVF